MYRKWWSKTKISNLRKNEKYEFIRLLIQFAWRMWSIYWLCYSFILRLTSLYFASFIDITTPSYTFFFVIHFYLIGYYPIFNVRSFFLLCLLLLCPYCQLSTKKTITNNYTLSNMTLHQLGTFVTCMFD